MANPNLIEMTWQDARPFIANANPKLAEIIDAWSPPVNYKLYKVAYRYGDLILKNGIFSLPDTNGNLLPIHHQGIPAKINKTLSYRSVPLGVITQNAQEVFLELENRIISIAYFRPGVILGLWESLENTTSFFPKQLWSVSAGARSTFMLPKISEAVAHKKLCKALDIQSNIIQSMSEHQPLFVEIAKKMQSDWRQEIIFFSNQWLERDEKNIGWLRFHHYLLEEGWALSEYNRNQISFELIWSSFARSLEKSHKKPSLYLLNTLQHLVGISTGKVPGFQLATDNEHAAPIKLLQDVYINKYGLRQYFPSIMQPYHFDDLQQGSPVYYSLQFPTCIDTLPKNRSSICLIDDLRELKDLMDQFIDDAKTGTLNIADTPVQEMINNCQYHYIHSDKDIYGQLMLSQNVSQIDRHFIQPLNNQDKRKFSLNSPFLRGCIAISRK